MNRYPIVKLESVCEKITDGVHNSPPLEESGIPMLDSTDINDLTIDDSNPKKYISRETDQILSKRCKPIENDILVSSRGSIGKIAIVKKEQDFNIMGNIILVRADNNILFHKYLALYLLGMKEFLENISRGVAQKGLYLKDIRDLKIPLPPLPIQQKIAEALDKADAIRKRNQQILEKYDQLAQSVFLEMFGDPVKNPKGWEIKKLKEVCAKITDGTHHSPPIVESGYPYVTAKHIKKTGVDFSHNSTYVSEKYHKEIYKRCNPEKGDVLYIKDGATTGIAAINPFSKEISLLSSLALLKPNYGIVSNYFLCFWLNDDRVKEKLISTYMSGAAIKRYTLKKINEFEMIVPPVILQNNFAQIIKNVETQKQKLQQEIDKSEKLFQSLLQRAFNGELFSEKKVNQQLEIFS